MTQIFRGTQTDTPEKNEYSIETVQYDLDILFTYRYKTMPQTNVK